MKAAPMTQKPSFPLMKQGDVKNSTAYTMAVIFNTICETHSDLLVDPYLNSLGGPPAPPAGR